jgi:ferritin-like protein
MSSEVLHESKEALSEQGLEMHRAIASLIEELEAVDWYQQRADACSDPELEAILRHHRAEEIEHAVMNLEWIRRRDSRLDEMLRTYLFTRAPLTEIEAAAKESGEHVVSGDANASLGIGSLRSIGSTEEGSA